MYTTISSKGQVTIPVEIRNMLRLNTGDRIDFVVKVVLAPHVHFITNPIEISK